MTLAWNPVHPDDSPLATLPEGSVAYTAADVYTGLAVTCYRFSLEVMLQLKFPFGDTKGKTNVQYFMLEMAAFTAGVYHAEVQNGRLMFERHGVGFRVGVASWDVSVDAASNLASVAASASVRAAKTNINIQTFGGNAIKNLPIFSQINPLDGLTPDALKNIASAGEQVTHLLATGRGLTPVVLAVATIDPGVRGDWQESAYSMQFAVESIYRGKSQIDAYRGLYGRKKDAEAARLFNPLLPQSAYIGFGLPGPSQTPSAVDRKLAEKILLLGR